MVRAVIAITNFLQPTKLERRRVEAIERRCRTKGAGREPAAHQPMRPGPNQQAIMGILVPAASLRTKLATVP